jgi:uncharacterized protein (DUF2342 family)
MRKGWVVLLGAAVLTGASGATLLGPVPVGAVARETVELQQSFRQLIKGQGEIQNTVAVNAAVHRALMEHSADMVNILSGRMIALKQSIQDMQTTGARLVTISTQIQNSSDNLQETLVHMGMLNQQLSQAHSAIEGIDAKLFTGAAVPQSTIGARFRPVAGREGSPVISGTSGTKF